LKKTTAGSLKPGAMPTLAWACCVPLQTTFSQEHNGWQPQAKGLGMVEYPKPLMGQYALYAQGPIANHRFGH